MTPTKLAVARKLAESGEFTVSLDPRRLGVSVPHRFRDRVQLELRLSSVHHVVFRQHGFTGTCQTMAGELIAVDVAWSAVFAMISGTDHVSGKFWGNDCPFEVRSQLAAAGAKGERRMVSAVVPSNVVSLAAYRQRKAGCP
jgi:hypothetical protein